MLLFQSLIVLASLAASSIAAPASSSTSTHCWTTMGSSSVRNCPTRWTTTTLSCTSTSTVVLTKSSTPQTQTSTVTKTTVTTKTGSASVSTATSTLLSTVTTTLVSSTIISSVSTSVIPMASTTTVSSSSDFVPVQSSFPGSSYDGNTNGKAGRRDENELTSPIQERAVDLGKRNNYHPGGYPQSVSCRAYPSGKCTTTTTTSTTTVVVPSPTTYTTVTVTSTVTSNPSATTTTTVSSTLTSTVNTITTFISVGTTTTTSYTSIATIFAACGSANVVDSYMGHPLNGVADYTGQANSFDLSYVFSTAVSYQDCCGQAYMDTNGPLVWLYGGSQCSYIVSQGEATVQSQNKLTTTYGDGSNGQYLIGNGRFGEWIGAISDGTI